jgi:hypothetical protein
MKYLMWFARYGSTEVREEYDITDCYDLDWMLDDADSAIFDQYGILCEVEEITDDGSRIIPDDEWEQGLEAYKAKVRAEREAKATPRPKPHGQVLIYPPFAEDGPNRSVINWVDVCTAYNATELELLRERWALQIGDERVKVRVFGDNNG